MYFALVPPAALHLCLYLQQGKEREREMGKGTEREIKLIPAYE